MAKDYRRLAQPSAPKKQPTPAWISFSYGLVFGIAVTGLAWYTLMPAGVGLAWPDFAKENIRQVKQQLQQEKPEPQKPKFDFYTILPEMEVVISDEEAAPPPAKNIATPTSAEDGKPLNYRLQVGSFKRLADADRQKARLALIGVEAGIEKVNIGQGEVYHRVLTQPFKSRQELNASRKRLQQNGINSLVVQIRQ
ncbi:MAG: SPOR domain-containing protein [Chromatiales bacterium]|jgi:cell division protein FtsN